MKEPQERVFCDRNDLATVFSGSKRRNRYFHLFQNFGTFWNIGNIYWNHFWKHFGTIFNLKTFWNRPYTNSK